MTRRIEDYAEWEQLVRPTFIEVAESGQPFVCWSVAEAYRLPEPPNRRRDWARLMSDLRREGITRRDGFGEARDHSAVRRWRGAQKPSVLTPGEEKAA